jgi:hypothetical protein
VSGHVDVHMRKVWKDYMVEAQVLLLFQVRNMEYASENTYITREDTYQWSRLTHITHIYIIKTELMAVRGGGR